VNTFFSRYPMTARDPDTWRKYAYALGMWLNFLAARAVGWDNAVPEDVEAFKYWRMADERNPQRVAPGTVTGNLIAHPASSGAALWFRCVHQTSINCRPANGPLKTCP
jgi:hypothetical protein